MEGLVLKPSYIFLIDTFLEISAFSIPDCKGCCKVNKWFLWNWLILREFSCRNGWNCYNLTVIQVDLLCMEFHELDINVICFFWWCIFLFWWRSWLAPNIPRKLFGDVVPINISVFWDVDTFDTRFVWLLE